MRQQLATLAKRIAQHLFIIGIARFIVSRLSLSLFLHQLDKYAWKVVLGVCDCRVDSRLIITGRLGVLVDAAFSWFFLKI